MYMKEKKQWEDKASGKCNWSTFIILLFPLKHIKLLCSNLLFWRILSVSMYLLISLKEMRVFGILESEKQTTKLQLNASTWKNEFSKFRETWPIRMQQHSVHFSVTLHILNPPWTPPGGTTWNTPAMCIKFILNMRAWKVLIIYIINFNCVSLGNYLLSVYRKTHSENPGIRLLCLTSTTHVSMVTILA